MQLNSRCSLGFFYLNSMSYVEDLDALESCIKEPTSNGLIELLD